MRKRDFSNKWISERIGAMPSHWDDRSLLYAVPYPTQAQMDETPLEYYEEMLEFCPDNFARSQGNVGSCVGWDFSFVIETQATIFHTADTVTFPASILALALYNLSAGWTYHWSKKYSIPPVPDSVEGSTNFGACRALRNKGIALEVDVPTDIVAPWDGITYEPDDEERALKYCIASYHRVDANPASIKAALYGLTHPLPYKMPDGTHGKSPLAAAYPVHSNFKEAYDDGMVPMPEGRLLGGHSSMLVGWKIIDGKEYFVNFNSWGVDVGDNGLFYIPVEYPWYPNDIYLLKIISNGPDPEPPAPGFWCQLFTSLKEMACDE